MTYIKIKSGKLENIQSKMVVYLNNIFYENKKLSDILDLNIEREIITGIMPNERCGDDGNDIDILSDTAFIEGVNNFSIYKMKELVKQMIHAIEMYSKLTLNDILDVNLKESIDRF